MSDVGDDTDDKIRRNLVAFSSIIILGAWLGVPLAALADKALAAGTLDKVTPWRVWVAVVAVQAYLILRFRFSADTLAEAQMLRRAWALLYQSKVIRMLRRHLACYSKKQQASPLFATSLADATDQAAAKFAVQIGKAKESLGAPTLIGAEFQFLNPPRSPTDTDETAPPLEPYRGYVNIAFEWPNGGASLAGSTEFRVIGWRRYALHVKTLWTLCIYSPEAMKLVIPSALAAVAAAIALFKLALSLVG